MVQYLKVPSFTKKAQILCSLISPVIHIGLHPYYLNLVVVLDGHIIHAIYFIIRLQTFHIL